MKCGKKTSDKVLHNRIHIDYTIILVTNVKLLKLIYVLVSGCHSLSFYPYSCCHLSLETENKQGTCLKQQTW